MQRKIEIIAEIGINHNGNVDLAKRMISFARNLGADVAKFQLFNAEKLIATNLELSEYNKRFVRQTELSKDKLVEVAKACDMYGIEFMASIFDIDLLPWLEELGVRRHKIPSPCVLNADLCRAVLATGKTTLVSDGYIKRRPSYFRHPAEPMYLPHPQVKWLYCISDYPTLLEDLRFYRGIFDDDVYGAYNYEGFSDHTIGITAAVCAMANGARIIEKHFTFDKSMDGPDHRCSMNCEELKQLCEMRDEMEIILYG